MEVNSCKKILNKLTDIDESKLTLTQIPPEILQNIRRSAEVQEEDGNEGDGQVPGTSASAFGRVPHTDQQYIKAIYQW